MIDAFISAVLAGYPQGVFAIVKRQFLSLYKKAKTKSPAAFFAELWNDSYRSTEARSMGKRCRYKHHAR
jgi:hypothetical protein